jgi:hypothetical protein
MPAAPAAVWATWTSEPTTALMCDKEGPLATVAPSPCCATVRATPSPCGGRARWFNLKHDKGETSRLDCVLSGHSVRLSGLLSCIGCSLSVFSQRQSLILPGTADEADDLEGSSVRPQDAEHLRPVPNLEPIG